MSLTVQVLPLGVFALDKPAVQAVRDTLAWKDSDFHKRLGLFLAGGDLPHTLDNELQIALVHDRGELVGWARTEVWTDLNGQEWQTLEAFVKPERRRLGFSALAAMALRAEMGLYNVAVFHHSMLLVAHRAGLRPTLFQKDEQGVWRMAQ